MEDSGNQDISDKIVQTEVLELIKTVSEKQCIDVEDWVKNIKDTYELLKKNVQNIKAFEMIKVPVANLFKNLDQQIKEIQKNLVEIK